MPSSWSIQPQGPRRWRPAPYALWRIWPGTCRPPLGIWGHHPPAGLPGLWLRSRTARPKRSGAPMAHPQALPGGNCLKASRGNSQITVEAHGHLGASMSRGRRAKELALSGTDLQPDSSAVYYQGALPLARLQIGAKTERPSGRRPLERSDQAAAQGRFSSPLITRLVAQRRAPFPVCVAFCSATPKTISGAAGPAPILPALGTPLLKAWSAWAKSHAASA